MGLMLPLLGVVLLSSCLVARELPYPESYAFKPYDAEIAEAKAMSGGCAAAGAIQCPTPDFSAASTGWPCVKYAQMCDGTNDCPQGEDEHPSMCMYHRMLDLEMERLRKVIVSAHRSA